MRSIELLGHQARLRNVGGSIMVAIPPALFDELLAQCRPSRRRTKEEREWLSSPRVDRELI